MFAATPDPPYTAVIFTSRRTNADEEEYLLVAQRMEELASAQPGYLGIESARDPHTRFGITVSYWATEAAARSWKVAEHVETQRLGAVRWYERYQVRVAAVGRAYGAWSEPRAAGNFTSPPLSERGRSRSRPHDFGTRRCARKRVGAGTPVEVFPSHPGPCRFRVRSEHA